MIPDAPHICALPDTPDDALTLPSSALAAAWVRSIHLFMQDGFPLPDIPHVRFTDPDLTFAQYAVRLAANVQYVP